MKKFKLYFYTILIVIIGCNLNDNNTQGNDYPLDNTGIVLLDVNLVYSPDNVNQIEAYLLSEDSDSLNGNVVDKNQAAEVTFSNVIPGVYSLSVSWKDESDQTIRQKNVQFEVLPKATIQVSMQNQELNDSIEVIVAREDSNNCTFGEEFQVETYDDNPIIPRNSSWNYASVVSPSVVVRDGIYYMWYTGRGDTPFQVGLATSTDGFQWEEYNGNPVLEIGDGAVFDSRSIRFPCVIFDEGYYKMWYAGSHQDATDWSIGYATSPDGIHWTKYSDNPVLQASDFGWDGGYVRLGSVLHVEDQYYMWYVGVPDEDTTSAIGVAFSDDGMTWVKSSYNPVLRPGRELFNSKRIAVTGVQRMKNGIFEMLYSGLDDLGLRATGRAVSDDGIFWVQDPLNPIISPAGTNDWNEYSSVGAIFIRKGNNYQFWFAGNGGYDSNWNIGAAIGTLFCE